ncbi:MAG: cbb3-type cytochrome c oxidase subunit I [bacterium]
MSKDQSSQPDTLSSADRSIIDSSVAAPVILFFGTSIFWLLFGSFFEVISAIKLVWPCFLDGCGILTYGRTSVVSINALAYGWATPAAIGIGLWLTARLCRVQLAKYKSLMAAGIVWNLGVFVGVAGLLIGDNTSITLLNFPAYSTHILLLSFLLIAVWAIVTFNQRQSGTLFVAQWFLVAGLFCFPWLYATANQLLVWNPIQASAQPAIAAWYEGGFFNLWLAPMGLAAAFYLIPKTIGRPVNSQHLSLIGFWSLLLFGAWSGTNRLIGGPLPAWIVSVGVAAGVLMIIPALAIALNLHFTLEGHYAPVSWSPALRFTVTGVSMLVFTWIFTAINSLPAVNSVTNFSEITRGLHLLGHYGFFSMTAFGAIYYILPRLTGKEWPSSALISWHFWLATSGVLLGVCVLLLGGLIQGFALQDIGLTFRSSIEFVTPFRFVAALAAVLILAANLAFALLFAGLHWAILRPGTAPALIAAREENTQEPVAV